MGKAPPGQAGDMVYVAAGCAPRHGSRMAYIRVVRVVRNGKVYEYRRLVRSVRIPGVGPRQIDMGKAPDLEPSVPAIPRTAVAPVELYDTVIPAGGIAFLCIAAANRDASAWREPDRFDPDRFSRTDTPRLLSFGAGTHYCLGTALAKIAVEESVRAVLAADPPLRLTENPADIPWRRVLGRSPARLVVSTQRAG